MFFTSKNVLKQKNKKKNTVSISILSLSHFSFLENLLKVKSETVLNRLTQHTFVDNKAKRAVNRLSWCLLKKDQKGVTRWLGWVKLQRILFR